MGGSRCTFLLKNNKYSHYWIYHVQVQGNRLHRLVTVLYCLIIPESRRFKSDSRYISLLCSNRWYSPVFQCLLCVGDQSFWAVVDVLVCSKRFFKTISQINLFDFYWESTVLWCLIEKNNKITYSLWKNSITANKPNQVYPAITWRRQILIIHRKFKYCKPNIHSTLSLSSFTNSSHVIDKNLPGSFSKWYQQL